MDPGPFENVLAALTRAEVRFLVVGGVASALNGFVRTTEDVDILVDADPDNIRRMLEVLSRFGEGHATELRVDDFTDEEGAVRLIEDFPIDIFTRMGGAGVMWTCCRTSASTMVTSPANPEAHEAPIPVPL